jgi:hypothetical protein
MADDRSLKIENLETRIMMLRAEQHRLFAVAGDASASQEAQRDAHKKASELSLDILKVLRELRKLSATMPSR